MCALGWRWLEWRRSALLAGTGTGARKPSAVEESRCVMGCVHEPPSTLAASHAKVGTHGESTRSDFSPAAKEKRETKQTN